MRRRGRAQDSTKGPDGPRLGYGLSQGDDLPGASWAERNAALVESFGVFVEVGPDGAWNWVRFVPEAVAREMSEVPPMSAWFAPHDRVRSGRERLGE
jgi:hypothetical protein